MVNTTESISGKTPEHRSAISCDLPLAFFSGASRQAVSTLLALDQRLGAIVRSVREPVLGQMRLAWWRDALGTLDGHRARDEPLLQAVQQDLLSQGIAAATLAELTGAWELLLSSDALDDADLARFAQERGGRLFAVIARLLGQRPETFAALAEAGEGWAMADLASHWSDARQGALAGEMARAHLDRALSTRWPRPLRPLGVMTLLARIDLEPEEARSRPLARFARVLRMSLTGR